MRISAVFCHHVTNNGSKGKILLDYSDIKKDGDGNDGSDTMVPGTIIKMMWLKTARQAKKLMIVSGGMIVLSLLLAGVFFGFQTYKLNSYIHVEGTVTAFNTSNNVWTQFEYSVDGKTYNVRLSGHSSYMRVGSKAELIVNPSNLYEAEVVYDNPYNTSIIVLIFTAVFSAFFVFYVINFLVRHRFEKMEDSS